MLAVKGNTYKVKEELKKLGGKWDAENKQWLVPDEAEEAVKKLRVPIGGREQLWEPCDRCGHEPVDSSGLCDQCRGTETLRVERVLSDDEQIEKILDNRNALAVNLYEWARKHREIPDDVGGRVIARGNPGGYGIEIITDGKALYARYIHHMVGDRDRLYKINTDRMYPIYKKIVNELIGQGGSDE